MQGNNELRTGDIVKFKSAESGDTVTGIFKRRGMGSSVTVAVRGKCEEYGNNHVYKSPDKLEKVGHTDEYDPKDPFGASVAECLENARENETVPVRCDQCGELFQTEKEMVVKFGKPRYCNEACGIKATPKNNTAGQVV